MLDYKDLLEKYKLPLGLSLVGIVLILGGIFISPKNEPKNFPQASIVGTTKEIQVDVSGAVVNPGVYKLSDNSRVEEAVMAAGGLSDKANQQYVSKSINMAQKLQDGAKVYIPFEGEAGVQGAIAGASTSNQVNINGASQSELEALPGIGPVTASKIISNRPYGSLEELVSKKVMGKATFEKIKDSLTLY